MASDTPNTTVQLSGTCGEASALHATLDDKLDLVHIGNLRVIIKPESPTMWVAQGLEIDYAADGVSLEDVKRAFADGLRFTIRENLRMFGSVTSVLRTAPPEFWHDYLTGAAEHRYVHSQNSVHQTIAGMELAFFVEKKAA